MLVKDLLSVYPGKVKLRCSHGVKQLDLYSGELLLISSEFYSRKIRLLYPVSSGCMLVSVFPEDED